MIDTVTPARPTAAQQMQAQACSVYRASYELGAPISGAVLGAKFGRSETWGLDRIREVKAELKLKSSPVTAPMSSLPPVTTPPSVPQEAQPEPAAAQQEPQAASAETVAPQKEPQPAPTETAAAPPGPQPASAETVAPQKEPQPAPTETAAATATPQEVPAAPAAPDGRTPLRVWPVWLLLLPASVAIWSGWVGLGEKAGFGPVQLLPGIADVQVNTAITLPIGMEVYSAYALYVWLSGKATGRALTFARISAIIALLVGALGQVAYHVMEAAGVGVAPWWITAGVACLPVGVVGLGAALAHMVRAEDEPTRVESAAVPNMAA
jgi:hypothetical protein